MYEYHQQLDMRLLGNTFTTVPRIVPGRMSTEDFVFFRWPCNVNPHDYTVAVQANDTAGPPWRSIGQLAETLNLPEVHFGAHAHIMVLPNREGLPRFWGRLNRASKYEIPDVTRIPRSYHNRENLYEMDRSGTTTASVNDAPFHY